MEASPLDRIWGIGLGLDALRVLEPAQWQGLSLLGFALRGALAREGAPRHGGPDLTA